MIVQDLINFLSNFSTEDVVIEGDNGVLQDIDRISYKMRENHMICTIVLVPKKEQIRASMVELVDTEDFGK